MFAIRARRKTVTEKDFLDAVNKVRPSLSWQLPAPPPYRSGRGQRIFVATCCMHCGIICHVPSLQLSLSRQYLILGVVCVQVIKGYQKFSATPKYMVYN